MEANHRSDAQHEHHEEEEHRENLFKRKESFSKVIYCKTIFSCLRHEVKLCDRIRIRDESQARTAFHHIADILDVQIVRQIAQNRKYRDAR